MSVSVFLSRAVGFSLVAVLLVAGLSTSGVQRAVRAAGDAAAAEKPVDDSMHHFMEYVFEPNYKRLRVSMASEPKDRQAWKGVKGDALTLAECANLLLTRAPKDDAAAWKEYSVTVRSVGGELYQAARASDYKAARSAYEKMLKSCNACHTKYADGKHQLKP